MSKPTRKPGDRFASGAREHVVIQATSSVVEYWDVYLDVPGRPTIRRLASRIQWDLDVASGALRLVVEPKGGRR